MAEKVPGIEVRMGAAPERIDHPSHYGDADNVYEAIKVIEAWALNFSLGNAVKYILRAGKKPVQIDVTTHADACRRFIDSPTNRAGQIEDLKKARWYVDREIQRLEKQ